MIYCPFMRTKNDMTFILWENAYWIIKNVEFDVCTTYSVCKFTVIFGGNQIAW